MIGISEVSLFILLTKILLTSISPLVTGVLSSLISLVVKVLECIYSKIITLLS